MIFDIIETGEPLPESLYFFTNYMLNCADSTKRYSSTKPLWAKIPYCHKQCGFSRSVGFHNIHSGFVQSKILCSTRNALHVKVVDTQGNSFSREVYSVFTLLTEQGEALLYFYSIKRTIILLLLQGRVRKFWRREMTQSWWPRDRWQTKQPSLKWRHHCAVSLWRRERTPSLPVTSDQKWNSLPRGN